MKTKKYLEIILVILFLFITHSCNSVTSPNDQTIMPVDSADNDNYSIILNKDTLDINDTLKIKIHPAKKSLTSGTIDYGDGSIINFSNLSEGVDTTFIHTYLNYGTYTIVIKFSIENGYLEWKYKVDISHFFSLKFPIGTKWVYQYYVKDINYMFDQFNYTKGIHTWEVLSYSTELSEYTIKISRIDSMSIGTHDHDSIFTKITEQYFTISDVRDTLRYNMPVGYLSMLRKIPNNQYLKFYPLILQFYWSYIVCEDKIGIRSYGYNPQISRYIQYYESLTLINYTTN